MIAHISFSTLLSSNKLYIYQSFGEMWTYSYKGQIWCKFNILQKRNESADEEKLVHKRIKKKEDRAQ